MDFFSEILFVAFDPSIAFTRQFRRFIIRAIYIFPFLRTDIAENFVKIQNFLRQTFPISDAYVIALFRYERLRRNRCRSRFKVNIYKIARSGRSKKARWSLVYLRICRVSIKSSFDRDRWDYPVWMLAVCKSNYSTYTKLDVYIYII